MEYTYTATTGNNSVKTGVIEALNEAEGRRILVERGYKQVKLKTLRRKTSIDVKTSAAFFRMMATYVEADLTIDESLERIIESTADPSLKSILRKINDSIKYQGMLFAEACEYQGVFSPVAITFLRIGEEAENLPEMLEKVADYEQSLFARIKKVKSAVLYPATVASIAMCVFFFILLYLVPMFKTRYDALGIVPQLVPRIMFAASDFLRTAWFVNLPMLGGTIFVLWNFKRIFPAIYDRYIYSVPLYGRLKHDLDMYVFTTTFGALMGAEVGAVNSLLLTARGLDNSYLAGILRKTADVVQEGGAITSTVRLYDTRKHFKHLAIDLLDTGEETNKVGKTLAKASNFFASELEEDTERLQVGLVVGTITFVAVVVALLVFTVQGQTWGLQGLNKGR